MWRVQAIPQPPAGISYHSTRCEGFLPQCPLRGYTITAPLFRGILKPPALRVIGAFPGRRAWGSRGVRMDARKRRDPIRMQHSHHHVIWILVVVWLLPISSFGPLQKTRHAPTLLSALDGDNRLTVPEVQTGSEPETPYVHEHRLTHTSVSAAPSHPFPWEREITPGIYENLGVSKIDRLGSQYTLTTYCTGMHRIFLHEHGQFDLARYINMYVRVQYRHVEETRHVQCVKAPCPPIKETRIVITHIEEMLLTEEERARYQIDCTAGSARQ
jgi:hypothetical protein